MQPQDDLIIAPLDEDLDALPAVYTSVAVSAAAPQAPWWRRWDRRVQQQARLDDLNLGIELYPDNATNYMLRGALFEEQQQLHLARADYEMAWQLAGEQVKTDRWGVITQTVQDRAMMGLRRVNNSD